ncbi:hypothetical protein RB595_004582 [Gaeumannomyces hyphopodioides]
MTSRSDAPLLSRADHRDNDSDGEAGPEAGPLYPDHGAAADEDDALAPKLPAQPPNLFVLLLVISAGLSGLLFGYDTGVISSTLVTIDRSLSGRELTSLDKSVITSCTALLALLVSPFSSALADGLGRRRVILLADALFAAGALLQALSRTVTEMVAGRSVVGAAVGAASLVVPLYIAETAPASHRGRLVTINVLFITLGQVVAYVVGWAFAEHYSDRGSGWRWMVGLGAAPAVVQAVLLLGMPETPRWLVRAGRSDEALAIIRKTVGAGLGSGAVADRVLKDIQVEVRDEAELRRKTRLRARGGHASWSFAPRWLDTDTWKELFLVSRNRRALAIACLLQGLQQLCGFNSLMYFSATIFTMVGFASPTLTSLTVAVTNFVFTVAALLLVDRIGRRRILLCSLPFMILGLLLAAFGFSFISISPSQSSPPPPPPPPPPSSGLSPQGAAVVVLISIMLYVGSYAIGLGNVPWMQSELFSLGVRSAGSGVATGTNWLANFIIGLTFLPLMDVLGPSWTFTMYGAICGLGLFLVWKMYPETAGLSLEEAASLLERDGWGVR